MQQEAKAFARLDVCPDVILTSPLVRARQTAEIAADALGCEKLENDERLANDFDKDAVASIVSERKDAKAIMFVGHEPAMSATIGALVGGARIALKKGGLALVELTGASPRSAQLVWLLAPKVLIR